MKSSLSRKLIALFILILAQWATVAYARSTAPRIPFLRTSAYFYTVAPVVAAGVPWSAYLGWRYNNPRLIVPRQPSLEVRPFIAIQTGYRF